MLFKRRFLQKWRNTKGLSELRGFWGQIELIKLRNKNSELLRAAILLLQMIPVA